MLVDSPSQVGHWPPFFGCRCIDRQASHLKRGGREGKWHRLSSDKRGCRWACTIDTDRPAHPTCHLLNTVLPFTTVNTVTHEPGAGKRGEVPTLTQGRVPASCLTRLGRCRSCALTWCAHTRCVACGLRAGTLKPLQARMSLTLNGEATTRRPLVLLLRAHLLLQKACRKPCHRVRSLRAPAPPPKSAVQVALTRPHRWHRGGDGCWRSLDTLEVAPVALHRHAGEATCAGKRAVAGVLGACGALVKLTRTRVWVVALSEVAPPVLVDCVRCACRGRCRGFNTRAKREAVRVGEVVHTLQRGTTAVRSVCAHIEEVKHGAKSCAGACLHHTRLARRTVRLVETEARPLNQHHTSESSKHTQHCEGGWVLCFQQILLGVVLRCVCARWKRKGKEGQR